MFLLLLCCNFHVNFEIGFLLSKWRLQRFSQILVEAGEILLWRDHCWNCEAAELHPRVNVKCVPSGYSVCLGLGRVNVELKGRCQDSDRVFISGHRDHLHLQSCIGVKKQQ